MIVSTNDPFLFFLFSTVNDDCDVDKMATATSRQPQTTTFQVSGTKTQTTPVVNRWLQIQTA